LMSRTGDAGATLGKWNKDQVIEGSHGGALYHGIDRLSLVIHAIGLNAFFHLPFSLCCRIHLGWLFPLFSSFAF